MPLPKRAKYPYVDAVWNCRPDHSIQRINNEPRLLRTDEIKEGCSKLN